MFSVFDYRTRVVSALFKANGLRWDGAGLLSVQRNGALLAFPGTARGICKSNPMRVPAGRVAFGKDGVMFQVAEAQ